MGAAPKKPIIPPLRAAPFPQATQSMNLTLKEEYKSPAQMIGEAFIKQLLGLLKSPTKPKMNYSTLQASHLPQASPTEATFENPQEAALFQIPQLPASLQALYTNSEEANSVILFDSNLDPNSIGNTENNPLATHPNHNGEMTQLDTITDSPIPSVYELTSPITIFPSPKSLPSPPPKKSLTCQSRKKDRNRMLPSRRSQRLQAKQRTVTIPKRSTKTTSQMKMISFNRDTLDTPIDIDTTLMILQATGLNINDHVRTLIEEAAEKDLTENQDDAITQQSAPTTPLHDPIPPLSVPDFDLPL